MSEVKITETSIFVIKCPECGEEWEDFLLVRGNKVLCPRCEYKLGEPEKLRWMKKKIEGVICDKCGKTIPSSPINFIMASKFKMVACPTCRNGRHQHIIAIHHQGEWLSPESFLHRGDINGLLKIRGEKDEIALELLNFMAKNERSEFRKVRDMLAKILWINGDAVGYYAYSPSFMGAPCMHQIYVLPEHRKKGYGQLMTEDFVNNFEGIVSFEVPMSQEYTNLLEKMGLLKREGEKLMTTGKIRFISGGL